MSSQEQGLSLGSLCILNSGSPILTVTAMRDNDEVEVCWFDDENQQAYAIFPSVCLTAIDEDETKLILG